MLGVGPFERHDLRGFTARPAAPVYAVHHHDGAEGSERALYDRGAERGLGGEAVQAQRAFENQAGDERRRFRQMTSRSKGGTL